MYVPSTSFEWVANFTRATCDEPSIAFAKTAHKLPSNCNESQHNDDNDDDDVLGKRAGTDQSRATFKAKRGSSTSPVDTMI